MKGVLLVNLGSPESPDPKDVKVYLDEFLMDERVIDLPSFLRTLLVRGIILNTRPKKSAKAYKKIWWKEGSPLIVLSKRLLQKMEAKVQLPVALGMRYGNPSIQSGLQELADKGVTEVLLVPLYPQFAMATTETILVLAEVEHHNGHGGTIYIRVTTIPNLLLITTKAVPTALSGVIAVMMAITIMVEAVAISITNIVIY